ncbi:Calcium-transporting ATPase [Aphelenchoides besseyi]|nr:Calcium-transporting ATPase [Aphelenchoides besseyi]
MKENKNYEEMFLFISKGFCGIKQSTQICVVMSFKRSSKEPLLAANVYSNVATSTEITCTLQELCDLMKLRGPEAQKVFHDQWNGVAGLCSKLAVDPRLGLNATHDELNRRRLMFGTNEIPGKKPKNYFQLVWKALKDTTLIILIVCAIFSLVLNALPQHGQESDDEQTYGWIEGAAILICVVVVVLVTATNDFTKERQFRALKAQVAKVHEFTVIRNGQATELNPKELVVGDILQVKYGDLLPADGVVIQSHELQLDEASLTGETDHLKKSPDGDPLLLSGTNVMEGSGKMVITAVGEHSQTGIVMSLLNDKTKINESDNKKQKSAKQGKSRGQSVLQQKLADLSVKIGFFGMIVAICTAFILILRYCLVRYVIEAHEFEWHRDLATIAIYIVVGVTVLVVAVPEGLPLAVTLSLAYSVRRMTRDHNLVRHLAACETMGNATVICSDKTGTLTTNRMAVVCAYTNGMEHKQPKLSDFDVKTAEMLTYAIAINSSYTAQIVPPTAEDEQARHVGNKTECGLLAFLQKSNRDYAEIRSRYPEEKLIKVFTFNSARKSMSTVIKNEWDSRGGVRVFCKGGAEIVIKNCEWYLGEGGKLCKFDETERLRVLSQVIEPMAADSLRTICVAYRDFRLTNENLEPNERVIDSSVDWNKEDQVVSQLTMLAIFGIQDPVRPEVPEAIQKCQEAGIRVIMVTGDNIGTARSIAHNCGILPSTNAENQETVLAIESVEFNQRIRENGEGEVVQELFDKIWPYLHVLARAQPVDKFTLVSHIIASHLRKGREVVAVTGDGTNDAPALKKADIGFAMGIAGTDVAKEASDIIVTDDNFSSIVTAVMWGRNVYDSIAKFLQFQLTVNVVAVLLVFIGACAAATPPLKAVQILWVNLLIDSLGSLALATESPTPELLQRKPYGRTSPIVSSTMARDKIFSIESGRDQPVFARPTQHFTIVFNTFVMMTLFSEVNARKIHNERNIFKGLFSNWIYCVIWITTFTMQILFVQFGDPWFSTAPLKWYQWLACMALGMGTLVWHQVVITFPANWTFSSMDVDVKESRNKTDGNTADKNQELKSKKNDVANAQQT